MPYAQPKNFERAVNRRAVFLLAPAKGQVEGERRPAKTSCLFPPLAEGLRRLTSATAANAPKLFGFRPTGSHLLGFRVKTKSKFCHPSLVNHFSIWHM